MAPTHVLFDFFGTLVRYSPRRTDDGDASRSPFDFPCLGAVESAFSGDTSETSAVNRVMCRRLLRRRKLQYVSDGIRRGDDRFTVE